MANVTTNENAANLLATDDNDFQQVYDTTRNYFLQSLSQLRTDFQMNSLTQHVVTSTSSKGYAPTADGNVTFVGTGFRGMSGTISSIAFASTQQDWTQWTLKGTSQWNSVSGIYDIHATSITIGTTSGNNSSGLRLLGDLLVDDSGLHGVISSQTTYAHGYTSTFTGTIDAETGLGAVTSWTLRDGGAGLITLAGNYTMQQINGVLSHVGTIGDALEAPICSRGTMCSKSQMARSPAGTAMPATIH